MEWVSTPVADLHMPALQAGGFRRCRDATDRTVLTDRCAGKTKQGKGPWYYECKPDSSGFVTRKDRWDLRLKKIDDG